MSGLSSNKYLAILLTALKWIFIGSGLLVGFVIVLVFAFAFAFMVWSHYFVFRTDTFDATVWKDQVNHNVLQKPCYRGGMAGDIKDRLLTHDMTTDDVIKLLGPPDQGSSDQRFDYLLGLCSGFQIDYDSLIIEFAITNHYARAYIVQH